MRAAGERQPGRRPARRGSAPPPARSWPRWRSSPTRRRRCWWRSSAPARARWPAATGRSTPVARVHRRLQPPRPRARRRPALRLRQRRLRDHGRGRGARLAAAAHRAPGEHRRARAGRGAAHDGPARRRRERALEALADEIAECRRCPRLVEWREQVAREKRAAFRDWEYWGRPIPRLRRSRGARARARPRARRPRRQPHRAGVHRRPLGRLPVRRAAPGGLRQPADVGPRRRRAAADATASSPPRCAARRRPTSRCRRSASAARTGWSSSWSCCRALRVVVCLGAFAWEAALRTPALIGAAGAAPAARVRPRRRVGGRRPHAARLLPPEPAEHVHRQADAGHDRRRVRARAASSPREALRGGPARAARGRADRRHAARALPDRDQRAGHRPLPARGHRLVRDRRRGGRLARRRQRHRRAGPGTAGRLASASAACSSRSAWCTPPRSARWCSPARRARRPACSSPAACWRASRSRPPRPCCARCGRTCCATDPRLLQTAYALDSVMIEMIFIARPAADRRAHRGGLAAGRAARVGRERGRRHARLHLAAALARVAAGEGGPRRDARRARLAGRAQPRARLAARPGWRSGSARSRSPRSRDAEGSRELAGVLLAVWSLGSVAGGLIYGALPSRPPLDKVHLAVASAAPARPAAAGGRAVDRGDGAARDPGRAVHRAAARDPQRAGRARRAAELAHRGLHVAGDRVRGRHLDRLGAGGTARRRARLAGRVPGRLWHRAPPAPSSCWHDGTPWSRRYRRGVPLNAFTPQVRDWFTRAFAEPTAAQAQAWPAIATGEHTLISAPTGSGKTLAAFLWGLDRLVAEPSTSDRTRLVYVSPLKALSYDVEKNLRAPLRGIGADVRVGIRTGDTPQKDRRDMTRHPPDILITTPESLYLMLTSQAREIFAGTEAVIVDEIHAVAQTKRGAHLAITLERLEQAAEGAGAAHRPVGDAEPARGGRPLHGRPEAHVPRDRRRRAQAAGPQDPRAGRVDGRAGAVRRRARPVRGRRGDPQVDLAGDLPADPRARPASTARRSSSSTTAAAPSGSRCGSTSSPPRRIPTSRRSRSRAPTTARWRARSGWSSRTS